MNILRANGVLGVDGVENDELLLQYGEIQGQIAAATNYRDLLNVEYIDEPVKGGTIKVKRMAKAASKPYGTTRTDGKGADLQNDFFLVNVDVEREFSEELNAKDGRLWSEAGGAGGSGAAAILMSRVPSYATGIDVELEKAYLVALETAATEVDVSGGSDTRDKLGILIRTLEAIEDGHTDKVERSEMILQLSPKYYDELEKLMTTYENPLIGRSDDKSIFQVTVRKMVRQGYDAIIQRIGSVCQPVVMDDFYLDTWQGSNDSYSYMSYYYGTKVGTPEYVMSCDLGSAGISA